MTTETWEAAATTRWLYRGVVFSRPKYAPLRFGIYMKIGHPDILTH